MLEKNKIGGKIFADVNKRLDEAGLMYGDSGYLGAPERPEIKEDEVLSKIEFRTSKRPSSLKMADNFNGINWDKKMEHDKSSVQCKIEHAFLIVKNQMGYAKTAYRGIEKNMNQFNVLFASANLLMCSRADRPGLSEVNYPLFA